MFTHEMIKSFNQLEMDVYNYIISNEEKVVYMKVRELAEAVHVSTTTILRFCKKVGCEGYSEFRLKLKQEVSSKEKKKINMDLTAVKDFFERVQTQAFAENIQEAVKLLTKASSIIFVGVGNSSFIGKYGARYFNNVGWFSFAIDDPFTPVFRGKGERIATIALSVSGETEQTLMLAEKLKRRGSSLISITNTINGDITEENKEQIKNMISENFADDMWEKYIQTADISNTQYRLVNAYYEVEQFIQKATNGQYSFDDINVDDNGKITGLPEKMCKIMNSQEANAKYEEIRDNIYMLTDYKNQYGLEDILAFKAGYNISDSEVSTVGTSGNNSVMDNAGYYKNMKTII